MAHERFDPEDFLDLRDVTPRAKAQVVTPIVAPPVYTRRPGAPARAAVSLDADGQRAAPCHDDTPPASAIPPAPQPARAPVHHDVYVAAAPARAPIQHNIPGAAAPTRAPVQHNIPGAAAPERAPIQHNIPGAAAPTRAPVQHTIPAAVAPTRAPIQHTIPGGTAPERVPVQHTIPGTAAPTRAPIQHTIPGAAAPTRAPLRAVGSSQPRLVSVPHSMPGQPRPAPVQHHIPGQPRPTLAALAEATPELPPVGPGFPAPEPVAAVAPGAEPYPEDDRFGAVTRAPRAELYPEDDPFADTLSEPLFEPVAAVPAGTRAPRAEPCPEDDPFAAALPEPQPAPVAAAPARAPQPPHSGAPGETVLRIPLAIAFWGLEYRAQSWTERGFTLLDPLPLDGMAPGGVIDLTLLIGQGVARIEMRVQARAEAGDAGDPRHFSFVGLDRAQAEALHRIVDHVVSHQALSLTRLLAEPESNPPAARPAAVPVPRATVRRTGGFRRGLKLALFGIALAAAGGTAWNLSTAIGSRYGAVTVEATSLSAPVAGVITAFAVAPGQAVARGEVLGYVRPADSDRRRAEMDERRQQLLDERADLLTLYDTMTPRAATPVSGADAGNDALVQVSVLASPGAPADAERAGSRTLESIERRIAAVTDELDQIDTASIETERGEPILSPCDCTVQGIAGRNGEWADPDQQLAVLVGSAAPTVHALVIGEEAGQIAIGNRARIRLADGTTLRGQVQRMSFDPRWRGFAGLPENVFAIDRYARIEVRPDQPLSAPLGTAATVTVQTNGIWARLGALAGL